MVAMCRAGSLSIISRTKGIWVSMNYLNSNSESPPLKEAGCGCGPIGASVFSRVNDSSAHPHCSG